MADRRSRLLGDTDVTRASGIEVGALHAPLVVRSEGPVIYVDYASTEELRRTLKHEGVDPASLVEVDVIWGGRKLRELIADPVDYVVASHVVEHVPDLIGWLRELHDVMKPDAVLGLAVPDRRYTFDRYRPESTLAEMVEAHLLGYRRPSLRQVFESCAFSTEAPEPSPRRPTDGLPPRVLRQLAGVYGWLRDDLVAAPTYIDSHCWVFTPASFLASLEALAEIGCCPFRIDAFHPTEPGAIEFQVRLRRTQPSDPAIPASIQAARARLEDTEEDEVASLRRRVAELERHGGALAQGLETMRRSTSWRMTAPLRSATRLLRRR